MIPSLIDKQDNFEVIRDQIAAILVTESANQQSLATTAGKDPELWKLRVYKERANPWEEFLSHVQDESPIVNVWYDNQNFDGLSSNIAERQKSEAVFNLDVYGYGKSKENGSGHDPGDRTAAYTMQRGIRLCRNILMAAGYTYLGLRGLVGQRWPQSITSFQPQQDSQRYQKIIAGRIAFRVKFNEFSPQVAKETLELISAQVTDLDSGQVIINADYEYPL